MSRFSGRLAGGVRIGPYRLDEPLGEGGMGMVWRAWDERLKRPVALKRLLEQAIDNPQVRERFRREAEAEARLNHPAIVHVYDLLETAGDTWIVLELVEGQTLRQRLAEGPFAVPHAVQLGREIAEGLAEAHARGIVHRDLKTGNVMVTPSGHAKILDFGIAKSVQPGGSETPETPGTAETTLSQPGWILGTSHAMSPEQALGLPLDARSDLFSLGSLLYEMVTGLAPFRAETTTATLARVCSYRAKPAWQVRPAVPRELSDLIDRLLEKEPRHRPQTATEVAAALGALSSLDLPEPAAAPPPEEPEEGEATVREGLPLAGTAAERLFAGSSATESRSRHPLLIWGGLALLLGLGLALPLSRFQPSAADVPPPAEAYELYRQGQAALGRFDKAGHLDTAIASFEQAIARNARHAPAYAGLARACWLKFDGESRDALWLDRARSAARQAVALDGDLAEARVSLGLVHLSSGQLAAAQQQIDQALILDPLNADAFYGLARLRESQGDLRAAETAYRRAAQLWPDRLFFDQLGSLFLQAGRLAEAQTAFQRSIELAPDGYIGYRNLATTYYSQGKLGEAASLLQRALEIQPHPSLYSNLGTYLFAQGLYDRAADAYEKALALPGGANKYQVWGNLGDAYRWLPGRRAKAVEAYRRALQLLADPLRAHPGDPILRSRRALFLAKQGDLVPALREAEEAARAKPAEAYTWYRLTVVYELCGRREQALAALGRALRAGIPTDEVKRDPELLRLREDVRYHRLVAGFEAAT